jgi:hypothetical protein
MAGKYDIVIEQGATFSRVITWKDSSNNPVDLTGYAARLQIRPTIGSGEPILTLTDGGGIELGGLAGTIALTISATQTAALNFSTANYDLELVSGETVKRLLRGSATLDEEYTRE